MSGSTVTSNALQFTNDNKNAYAYSGIIGVTNAEKTLNYNENIISEMETFDADNPVWSAVTNYIEVAGPPANRIYQKTTNLRG